MNKILAIIVLNYNGLEDTKECIESLLKFQNDEFEIFLIDNASTDESGNKLHLLFPGIQFFPLHKNSGYASGNNYGIKIAYSQGFNYFLVLNNDVITEPLFYRPLLEIIKKEKNVGAVTCKVLYKNNKNIINAAGGYFSKLLCTGVNFRIGEIDNDIEEKKDVDFIPGMLILISREVVDKIGLMKEYFFLYFEDLEYSLRINKEFRLVYTSRVKVYHKSGGGIRGKSYPSHYLFYYTRNRIWMFKERKSIYFFYVITFSLINCLTKSFLILFHDKIIPFKKGQGITKLKSLWLGFFAGIFSNPILNNVRKL